jgi:hypothetical protein
MRCERVGDAERCLQTQSLSRQNGVARSDILKGIFLAQIHSQSPG